MAKRSRAARMRWRRRRRERRRRRALPLRLAAPPLLALLWLIGLLSEPSTEPPPRKRTSAPAEDGRRYALRWQDGQRTYAGDVAVSQTSHRLARWNRLNPGRHAETGIAFPRYVEARPRLARSSPHAVHWAWVYENLIRHDGRFDELHGVFEAVRDEHALGGRSLASMAVTLVQSIPYTLIHQDTCRELLARDPTCGGVVCQYHENGFQNPVARGQACLPETPYGLLSPLEFLYTRKGDCDTRVVLLFCVLKRLGFDVAVLFSREYQHCVLGIALPGRGTYKAHRGKRYYTWETVEPHWQIGQLMAHQRHMRYWRVLFTS